jgi:hypothetical protein
LGRKTQQPPWLLVGRPVICRTCFRVIPKVG